VRAQKTYIEPSLGGVDLVLEGSRLELHLGLRDVGLGLRHLVLGVLDHVGHVRVRCVDFERRQERVELLEGLHGVVVVLLVVPVLDEILLCRRCTVFVSIE
jgi:hypothetical protein